MAVYEALLLNTAVPQIQAAQAGDSYVMVVNSSTDALRITQTGAGNALVVEDSTNPDSTPFVVSAAGDVGIGTSSPTTKLYVTASVASTAIAAFFNTDTANGNGVYIKAGGANAGKYALAVDNAASASLLYLDSSGNLGLGVTPSAWGSGWPALQVGSRTVVHSAPDGRASFGGNYYVDGTDARYIASAAATQLMQVNGDFRFFTAPSGTAGNAISFTQAMTLDASGNLVVGGTSASAKLQVVGGNIRLDNNQGLEWGGGNNFIYGNEASDFVAIATNGSERARITSGGDFLIGTNDAAQGSGNGNKLVAGGAVWVVNAATADGFSYYNSSAAAYRFYVSSAGTISATNTTISAISDQRLKENIQDLDVGLDKILALKPRKFDWKEGKGKDIKGDRGWIAQEFEQVFPDMIDEWKDPAPEGEEPYKSVRADLIPVLVKAIQELKAEVDSLKAQLEAK